MKILKLPKKNLDFFVSVLHKFGEVHAPLRKGENGVVFGKIPGWSDVVFDYHRTIIPPKKYFLKPQDAIFSFSQEKGYVPNMEERDKKIVIFGIHPCDINAIKILDQVFSGKYVDNYYFLRRNNIAIIGVDCIPDDKCFCRSMRTDFVDDGFDLFFSDIGDSFVVLVGTSLGDDMVLSTRPLFQDVNESDMKEYKRRSNDKRQKFTLDVELRDLPEIIEIEYQSSTWEELGRQCVSCGSCSMVCPTCYCYDVFDELMLDTKSGYRKRVWDSCLFKEHALVAGGHNFRKDRSSRVKFRYYHKQRGFVAEYGRPSCVGCGRCIVACPAKIDIVEVINRLRGEGNEQYAVEHGKLR